MRKMKASRNQAGVESNYSYAVVKAVNAAALAIGAEISSARVLQTIVEQARKLTNARYAALGIGSDPKRPFDPWVFSGMDEAVARLLPHFPRPQGLLGAVVLEGHKIRLRDITKDSRYRGFPLHHPQMTSFLGVPIRHKGETIGNLYLTEKTGADEFTEQDEEVVEMLAAHAAIAYRQAQLYEQLHTAHTRFETLFENSPAGIVFVEAATDRVYENEAARALFGRRLQPEAGRQQYVGQFFSADGLPLSLAEFPTSKALWGEVVVGAELVVRRPDGEEKSVLANAAPVRNAQGVVTAAVVIIQDATPLKLERLREEFVSIVAHDLRTPINVITGFGELLSRDLEKKGMSAGERRAVAAIQNSARRLNHMVQDLLDASRLEARRLTLEKRPVDIPVLVQEVVERLSPMLSPHPLLISVQGTPPMVEADPGRIEQVLTNLLTNAAKYSPPETDIQVAVVAEPQEVMVSVTDHGLGIAPDDIPKLFSRFFRTKEARASAHGGLGIGLYISKSLVEVHGGRMWIESEVGKGSTFYFALPAAPSVAANQKRVG
ncbi:MAG: GAF domain-containing protein [Chloroflexi bacterium]|nr:GAF domain-containing protein [Chloroflexota bacterium]